MATGKITVRTSLLAAIAKWTIGDATRPILELVLFDGKHMVATDGHRMVAAPFQTGGVRFGLHRLDIAAAAAAQRELKAGTHSRELDLEVDGKKATLFLDHKRSRALVVEAHPGDDYPPYEQVFPSKQETPAPGEFSFNPKYLAAIEEVIKATGCYSELGVRIKAWSAIDDKGYCGPMLFESAEGIRFAIMPMRGV